MGKNRVASCAKKDSCTNTSTNVIVSFRNPESKAAGPKLATALRHISPPERNEDSEETRLRVGTKSRKTTSPDAPHLYQTPGQTKVAVNLQGDGQGSVWAAAQW